MRSADDVKRDPRPGDVVLRPITLKCANAFVREHHRHSDAIPRNGGKFAISAVSDQRIVGVVIVGNPLSATYMDGTTAEALRVCVVPDAPKNTCSMLYGAAWRAWRAMGGLRMVTYTLQKESGASLRGAGWRLAAAACLTSRNWGKGERSRKAKAIYAEPKWRWEVLHVAQ